MLRVKRKRDDDPVDAFFFQHHVQSQMKRRGLNVNEPERGLFRRKETINADDVPQSSGHIIEAEWDSASNRMKLKRKNEEETESPRKHITTDMSKHMSTFSDMLRDYVKCTCDF